MTGAGVVVPDPANVDLLRAMSRHGTWSGHNWPNGEPCDCWRDAERALRDLRDAGYEIVQVTDE